jgi:malate/lactate dehydrogenase
LTPSAAARDDADVKVTLVGGAGGVGSSVAFNLLLTRRPCEIVLVDPRQEMVESHVMDLEQTLEWVPGAAVRGGGEDDVADADIVVVSAAVPLTLNTSRLVYLVDNARIADSIAALLPRDWTGVAVVVTNPVDPLVTRFQRRSGLDRSRVLGYTVNDTLRLRTGIAKALDVTPGSVEAWVVGEHGDTCVPLWERVTVDGARAELTEGQRAAADEFLRTWYLRHVGLDSGRTSTWTTGLGVTRMIDAVCDGAAETWPVSLVLDGEYGISGVAVTVTAMLGPAGAIQVHEWELEDEDVAAMRASAALVRSVTASIDEPAIR